ncbi:hypothetical protein CTAYLR_010476 [Chrysophaeum taylorii]|uniref:Uncharacterized protein n=1 Tax=Chrysophaeum taylorii TaxID=2483200 RepID=A0AAD7XPC0_9STRA|nr:hypothetical protein CTAYLR_010476 [Chrysophaeum taylorii]
MLLVKFGRIVDALPVAANETAHQVVARRFDVPVARLSLICRGRKFPHSWDSTRTLLAESALGHHTLVIGTRASEQLDVPRGVSAVLARVPIVGARVAVLAAWCERVLRGAWRALVPRIVGALTDTVHFVAFFLGSFVPSSSRRPPSRRPPRPHAD